MTIEVEKNAMASIIRFLIMLAPITSRLGICGNVGFVAGTLAGFVISDLAWVLGSFHWTDGQALRISLLLALFSWVFVLLIFCGFARFTLRSIASPSLFNCLLSCLVTVFVSKWLDANSFAWLIGMLMGSLVGMLLCKVNAVLDGLTRIGKK